MIDLTLMLKNLLTFTASLGVFLVAIVLMLAIVIILAILIISVPNIIKEYKKFKKKEGVK